MVVDAEGAMVGLRRTWLVVLVVALLAGTAACVSGGDGRDGAGQQAGRATVATGDDSDPRPNVVLVVTDDMAIGDLRHLPNVRRLITQQGTRFTRSYAPFPLCCPDRVTLVTGQYAHNHGVLGNGATSFPEGGYEDFRQGQDDETLGTWMHDAGYQTAWIGKYLNGYGVEARQGRRIPPGWDDWQASVGDYRKVTAFEGSSTHGDPVADVNVYRTYNSTWVTNRLLRVVRQRVEDGGPLLLVANYHAPHVSKIKQSDDPGTVGGLSIRTPTPAERDRDEFKGTPLPDTPDLNEKDVSDKTAGVQDRPRLTRPQLRGLTELHQQRLESLLAVDRGVKRLVEQLRESGELRNTVIAFTSDNGYLIGQHRIPQGKVWPYETGVRVPLVIRGPGFRPGSSVDQLTGSQDLAATFVDLADAAAGRVLDGLSLRRLVGHPDRAARRDLVIEAGPRRVGGPYSWRGLRTDRYSYVEYAGGAVELYDLREDPYQLRNVADDPAYAGRVQRLADQLRRMRDCAGAACRVGTDW